MALLLNVTLLAILFPWVSFGLLNLDTQPWFILLSTVFLFFNLDRKFNFVFILSLILLFLTIVVGVGYGVVDFLFVRAVLGSYAFFVVLNVIYIAKRYYAFPVKTILIANAIWLIAGLIQKLFGKGVLSFLVTVRTTEDRGVTGLAPEPTYYGIFLFFLTWILFLERKSINPRVFRLVVILNFIFIVFVAKSSMVILFICILFFLYLAFYLLNVKIFLLMLLSFLSLVFLYPYISFLLYGSRVQALLEIAFVNPELLIKVDASINERISHVYFSIKGFVTNLGFPQGFHNFSNELMQGRLNSNGVFWWGNYENKIMSGTGSLLYELGLLSLPFFLIVFNLVFSKNNLKESLLFLLLFLSVFSSAIPLSFSLVPMLLVLIFFYFNRNLGYEVNSSN